MSSPISSNWFYYMTMASMAQAMPSINQNSIYPGNASNENSLFYVLLNAAMQSSQPQNAAAMPFETMQPFASVNASYTPLNIQSVRESTPTSTNLGSFNFKPMQFMKLENSLKGKLGGSAVHFINAGKQYNIHPGLLTAIAIHETGNGSSRAVNEKNNVAGMMGKNGLKSYDSIEDSIFAMARNLRKNYLDQGKGTISEIGAKYAPVGAANDPTGLNNHWTKGVSRQFNNLV